MDTPISKFTPRMKNPGDTISAAEWNGMLNRIRKLELALAEATREALLAPIIRFVEIDADAVGESSGTTYVTAQELYRTSGGMWTTNTNHQIELDAEAFGDLIEEEGDRHMVLFHRQSGAYIPICRQEINFCELTGTLTAGGSVAAKARKWAEPYEAVDDTFTVHDDHYGTLTGSSGDAATFVWRHGRRVLLGVGCE